VLHLVYGFLTAPNAVVKPIHPKAMPEETDVSMPAPWDETEKNRYKHFVVHGEAVILGVDGVADFNALHSRRMRTRSSSTPSTFWRTMARILRGLSLSMRKTNLAQLLRRPRRHLRRFV
jgi:ATP-dependent DNA ligase